MSDKIRSTATVNSAAADADALAAKIAGVLTVKQGANTGQKIAIAGVGGGGGGGGDDGGDTTVNINTNVTNNYGSQGGALSGEMGSLAEQLRAFGDTLGRIQMQLQAHGLSKDNLPDEYNRLRAVQSAYQRGAEKDVTQLREEMETAQRIHDAMFNPSKFSQWFDNERQALRSDMQSKGYKVSDERQNTEENLRSMFNEGRLEGNFAKVMEAARQIDSYMKSSQYALENDREPAVVKSTRQWEKEHEAAEKLYDRMTTAEDNMRELFQSRGASVGESRHFSQLAEVRRNFRSGNASWGEATRAASEMEKAFEFLSNPEQASAVAATYAMGIASNMQKSWDKAGIEMPDSVRRSIEDLASGDTFGFDLAKVAAGSAARGQMGKALDDFGLFYNTVQAHEGESLSKLRHALNPDSIASDPVIEVKDAKDVKVETSGGPNERYESIEASSSLARRIREHREKQAGRVDNRSYEEVERAYHENDRLWQMAHDTDEQTFEDRIDGLKIDKRAQQIEMSFDNPTIKSSGDVKVEEESSNGQPKAKPKQQEESVSAEPAKKAPVDQPPQMSLEDAVQKGVEKAATKAEPSKSDVAQHGGVKPEEAKKETKREKAPVNKDLEDAAEDMQEAAKEQTKRAKASRRPKNHSVQEFSEEEAEKMREMLESAWHGSVGKSGGSGGGKGGGGSSDGGGSGDGSTPPGVPSAKVKYFDNLEQLTKFLDDAGLQEISGDINKRLEELQSDPKGISVKYGDQGELTGVSLSAMSRKYGNIQRAELGYGITYQENEATGGYDREWFGAYRTHTNAAQMAKLDEDLSKKITAAGLRANAAYNNPIVQSGKNNEFRQQLEDMFGPDSKYGKIENGEIKLKEKMNNADLQDFVKNLGNVESGIKDANSMMRKRWSNNSIENMERYAQDDLDRRDALTNRLRGMGINAEDTDAVINGGKTKVADLFKGIDDAYQRYSDPAASIKERVQAYNDLEDAVTSAEKAVRSEQREYATQSKENAQQSKIWDVVDKANEVMDMPNADKIDDQYQAVADALEKLETAKGPKDIDAAIREAKHAVSELKKETQAYNRAERQAKQDNLTRETLQNRGIDVTSAMKGYAEREDKMSDSQKALYGDVKKFADQFETAMAGDDFETAQKALSNFATAKKRLAASLKETDQKAKEAADAAQEQAKKEAAKAEKALAQEQKAAKRDAERDAAAQARTAEEVATQARDLMNSPQYAKVPKQMRDEMERSLQRFDTTNWTQGMNELQRSADAVSEKIAGITKSEQDAKKAAQDAAKAEKASDILEKRINNRNVDIDQMRQRMKEAGATMPESFKKISREMGAVNQPRASEESQRKHLTEIDKNWRQAQADVRKAITEGKQEGAASQALKQANQLLASAKLDKNGAAYRTLEGVANGMAFARTPAERAQQAGLIDKAMAGAQKAIKQFDTEAKKAEGQYERLQKSDYFKGLSQAEQSKLTTAYNAFKTGDAAGTAESLKELQDALKGTTQAISDQKKQNKAYGFDADLWKNELKFEKIGAKAGGYDQWKKEDQEAYDRAQMYRTDAAQYAKEGNFSLARESMQAFTKEMSALDASLTRSVQSTKALRDAQEKADKEAADAYKAQRQEVWSKDRYDVEQRASQRKMQDAEAKERAGVMWTDEQRQAYNTAHTNALVHQADMEGAAAKGDWEAAGKSLGLYNKELAEMNALVNAGNSAYQARQKELEKAFDTNDKEQAAEQARLEKAIDQASKAAVAAQQDKYYQRVPEDRRDAMEDAFADLALDGGKTQANVDALNNAVKQVNASMSEAKDNNYWQQQSAALDAYTGKMEQFASKYSDPSRWTQQQKDAFQDTVAEMATMSQMVVERKDQAGVEQMSQGIRDMQQELESSLKDSEKLLDEFDKTTKDKLFKGVGDNLKQELQQAKDDFISDGSLQSANALADSIQRVGTAMNTIRESDAFRQQTSQLEKMQAKLQEMSTKNGGMSNWTHMQGNQYRQMVGAYNAYANMTGHTAPSVPTPPTPPPGSPPIVPPDYGTAGAALKDFNAHQQVLNSSLKQTAKNAQPVNQQMDALTSYLLKIATPMMAFRKFANYMKKAASQVKAVDTQMADLKKVTDNSGAEYQQFLDNTTKTAIQIATPISDLVAATSTFAHMGYSLTQAASLGTTATKFASVGNFQNTTAASEAMIAVINGFSDLDIGDAESVGDKMTAIANKYAVTASDISNGLQNSASALNLAGNSVDQSAAMITAIAETTRDASAAGSALKVLSMRIRGAKTELTY